MRQSAAGTPDFYEISFKDEKDWRTFLAEAIENHSTAYIEPTGSIGFFLERALVPWAERWVESHLNRESYSLVAIKVSEDPDDEEVPHESAFRHRGKALDPNYDDPQWLAAERDRLRKENEELRRKIKG